MHQIAVDVEGLFKHLPKVWFYFKGGGTLGVCLRFKHLQDTSGSIWEDLHRQHPRARSHLLVDELLLRAWFQQTRIRSQHHLRSIVQSLHAALRLDRTDHRLQSDLQLNLLNPEDDPPEPPGGEAHR